MRQWALACGFQRHGNSPRALYFQNARILAQVVHSPSAILSAPRKLAAAALKIQNAGNCTAIFNFQPVKRVLEKAGSSVS